MQHTQIHAKSVKNDLKPMDFLKRFILRRREQHADIMQRCNVKIIDALHIAQQFKKQM